MFIELERFTVVDASHCQPPLSKKRKKILFPRVTDDVIVNSANLVTTPGCENCLSAMENIGIKYSMKFQSSQKLNGARSQNH